MKYVEGYGYSDRYRPSATEWGRRGHDLDGVGDLLLLMEAAEDLRIGPGPEGLRPQSTGTIPAWMCGGTGEKYTGTGVNPDAGEWCSK